jgi:hypothetical protein
MFENSTLAEPTNIVPGQSGVIEITQNDASAKTLAFDAFWGTVDDISADLSSVNILSYVTDSSGTFATCVLRTRT